MLKKIFTGLSRPPPPPPPRYPTLLNVLLFLNVLLMCPKGVASLTLPGMLEGALKKCVDPYFGPPEGYSLSDIEDVEVMCVCVCAGVDVCVCARARVRVRVRVALFASSIEVLKLRPPPTLRNIYHLTNHISLTYFSCIPGDLATCPTNSPHMYARQGGAGDDWVLVYSADGKKVKRAAEAE